MVETTTTTVKPTVIKEEPKGPDEVCLVDLGRQTKRRIKRLRRGHGPLMRKVQNAIEALQEEGVVASGGSVVVLLVREKPSVASLFDDDDDDDDYDDDDDDD